MITKEYPNFANGMGTDRPFHVRKLTAEQRTEIGYRRMEGESSRDLALEYGVSRGTIDFISKVERP
jgi:hypothetical protein